MAEDEEDILLNLAEKFIADVEATTALRPTCSVGQSHGEIPEWARWSSNRSSPSGAPQLVEAMLWINRTGTGAAVEPWLLREKRYADVLAHMADEWSEAVGEVLVGVAGVEVARTWPRCPRHDHAMDPIVEEDRAWWACRDDQSVRVPIGELTTP
jgi:hypothetical protein